MIQGRPDTANQMQISNSATMSQVRDALMLNYKALNA